MKTFRLSKTAGLIALVFLIPGSICLLLSNSLKTIASAANNQSQAITASVFTTIKVGSRPIGVVFSPDGSYAYVTHISEPTVRVIRVSDHTQIDTISIGTDINSSKPDITPDGKYLFVPLRNIKAVAKISLSQKKVLSQVNVSNEVMAVEISKDGSKVYVGTFGSGLDVIDASTNLVVNHKNIGGSNVIYDLVLSPDGSKLYIARSSGTGAVVVVNTSDLSIQDTISLSGDPNLGIDVNPAGTWIWTTNSMQNRIVGINLADRSTHSVSVSGALGLAGVAVSPDGQFVYVGSWAANKLHVVRTSDQTLVQTLNVGSHPNSYIDTTLDGRFLYVPSEYDNKVWVIDTGNTGSSTYSISGKITDTNSPANPIPGVTVSDNKGHSTTTDSHGIYNFNTLGADSYTITPSSTNYNFVPTNRTVVLSSQTMTGQDFKAVLKNPPVSDTEITGVEITQAISTTLYVAGKATVVRVFLSNPVMWDKLRQFVNINYEGNNLTPLYPDLFLGTSSELTFQCAEVNCKVWLAGNYSFTAHVNNAPEWIVNATFRESKSLRILFVPVKVKDRGKEISLPDDQWRNAENFLNKVYPIADNSILRTYDSGLDATNLVLTDTNGQYKLWDRLNSKQPIFCDLPFRPACYDEIVGFIPPMSICSGGGCKTGWTYSAPATVVMANGSYTSTVGGLHLEIVDMEHTVAHEIGHNYDLGDEYNLLKGRFQCLINPPPASYWGCEWGSSCNGNNYQCVVSNSLEWNGRHVPNTTASGSRIAFNTDHPFEANGRGLILTDTMSYMGSGAFQADYWTTIRAYNHLYSRFVGLSSEVTRAETAERIAQISGLIAKNDSVTINPWYSLTTTLSAPITGTYSIEAVDTLSNTLASNGFEVSFIALSNPPEDIDPAPFQAIVGFPNETKAFRIKHGDTVLGIVPVSAHSPMAQILEPQNGEIISGTTTVQWQSSDQDGDTLYHTLEYSHNGTDWQVLTSNITTTQTTVNFDALPGSNQAYLRLFVTDGVNTTQATSQPFIVAAKPPQVFITYPLDGATFAFGQNISLVGNAYDPQDGSLYSDSALQWTSDRDGVLGQGYTLNIGSLSSGNHTITLIATDSLGMVSSASIVIHIINISNLYLPVIGKP